MSFAQEKGWKKVQTLDSRTEKRNISSTFSPLKKILFAIITLQMADFFLNK
jgi:hypothetical protein